MPGVYWGLGFMQFKKQSIWNPKPWFLAESSHLWGNKYYSPNVRKRVRKRNGLVIGGTTEKILKHCPIIFFFYKSYPFSRYGVEFIEGKTQHAVALTYVYFGRGNVLFDLVVLGRLKCLPLCSQTVTSLFSEHNHQPLCPNLFSACILFSTESFWTKFTCFHPPIPQALAPSNRLPSPPGNKVNGVRPFVLRWRAVSLWAMGSVFHFTVYI